MSCNLGYARYYNACLTQSVTHLVTQRLHSAINTSYSTTSCWHVVHFLGLWLMPQHCPSHHQCRCLLAWPFCFPPIYHKGTNLQSSLQEVLQLLSVRSTICWQDDTDWAQDSCLTPTFSPLFSFLVASSFSIGLRHTRLSVRFPSRIHELRQRRWTQRLTQVTNTFVKL